MGDDLKQFEKEFSERLQHRILLFLRNQEFPHLQRIDDDEPDDEASERYCGLVVFSSLVNIGIHLADQRGLSQDDILQVLDDYRRQLPSIVVGVTSPGGSG
jgi:hypothetical protein